MTNENIDIDKLIDTISSSESYNFDELFNIITKNKDNIELCSRLLSVYDLKGINMLMYVLQNKKSRMARLFQWIIKFGVLCCPQQQDEYGYTMLMWSCKSSTEFAIDLINTFNFSSYSDKSMKSLPSI